MSDGKSWSFWRDAAKLAIFDPEKRLRYWVSMVAALGLSAAMFVVGDDIGLSTLTSRLMGFLVPIVGVPLALCCEMGFKGANAGQELKNARDEFESQLSNQQVRREATRALVNGKQAFKAELHWGGQNYPAKGTGDDVRTKQAEFLLKYKERVLKVAREIDSKTEALPGLQIGFEELEAAINYLDLRAEIERKLELLDAMQSRV